MPKVSCSRSSERGSALLDLVFAVALLGLFVGVLIPALITGRTGASAAGARARATLLADEGMEAVRNLDQSGFSTLTAGTYGLTTAGTQWALGSSPETIGPFSRTITITPVDANRANVTATVTWPELPSRTGLVSVVSRFTNWLRTVVVTIPLPAQRIAYYQVDSKDLKYGSCTSSCDVGTNWTTVIIDSADDVGQFASLALDVDKPRISYWDATHQALKYASCDANCTASSSWQSVIVDTLSASVTAGGYTSLAINNGHARIAYDDPRAKHLKYASCDANCTASSSWTTVTIDGTSGVGEYASLALDGDKSRISYWNSASEDLRYASCDSACTTVSNWTKIAIDTSGDVGQYTSIGLVNGQPRISYYQDSSSDLRYASCDSACTTVSNWTTVTVDATGQVGKYTSITFDQGKPRIGYWKENSKNLKYAACDTNCTNASSWANVNVATADDMGSYASLAVQAGSPRLAYRDKTNHDLSFAICQTNCLQHSSWSTVVVDANGDTGLYPSLNR